MNIRSIGCIIVVMLLLFGFFAKAQRAYLQSGYTQLVIHSTEKISPSLMVANPLRNVLPEKLSGIGDTVFFASFYTFGPTAVRLHILDKDYPFLVLPNRTSTITVRKTETGDVDLQYFGPFNTVFDESMSIYNLTGEGYYKHLGQTKIYTSSTDYKDERSGRYNKIIEEVNR